LRNLSNPKEWLENTDPAHEAVLTVSMDEVAHATRPRFVSRASGEGGLKGSMKRALAQFGGSFKSFGRTRRASASSTSALSSLPDGPPESPMGSSRDPSRHASASGTPQLNGQSPSVEAALGRKWSVKSRFGSQRSARSGVGTPVDTPGTPQQPVNGLHRSTSNSSAHTSTSSPTFSRRPSANAALAHLGGEADLERGKPTIEHKLSIKHVWSRLRSGSRTPNAAAMSSSPPAAASEEHPVETDDSASIAESEALSNADAISEAAASLSRGDFDQFGRRRVYAEEDEEEGVQVDDLSDDSLSSLEDGDDQYHGQAWNVGYGWNRPAADDSDGDHSPPAHPYIDDLRTPRGPGSSARPHSLEADDDALSVPGSSGGPSSNGHRMGSGEDADAEGDEDDADRLEVNFGRSRRCVARASGRALDLLGGLQANQRERDANDV
jgi:hypothetical protein